MEISFFVLRSALHTSLKNTDPTMNITVLATYSFVIISLIATKKQPTLIKQKMPTRRVSNTSTSQRIRLFVHSFNLANKGFDCCPFC